jgi:hypothetical protein
MHFVREGLRKFVDEQMQEGDLVAIIRTGGGVGALQQFTTDKQLLHAASQFIEVPRMERNRLTLSGIYLASNQQATAIVGRARGAMPVLTSTREDMSFGESDQESGPAVRRFQAGTVIDYGFEIYNAKIDRATGKPQLETQVRLFRDNQQVYAGRVIPIRVETGDASRVAAIGHLQLGTNLVPGE